MNRPGQTTQDCMEEFFSLPVSQRIIEGVVHLPDTSPASCVIACHGLFSSKDSEKFTALADYYVKHGIAVVRFDFSGCGGSSGRIADTTVSRRLEELDAVVRFVGSHAGLGSRAGLMGSSLGGFVALLYASSRPVDALSVWATPIVLEEIAETMPEDDLARLDASFFSDARTYRLEARLPKLSTVQILHGSRDAVVPRQHAEKIHALIGVPRQLHVFPDADHSLTDTHDRHQAIAMSCEWFLNYL